MSAGLLSALVWLLFIAALVGLIWWLYREPPHVTLHREMRGSGMVGLSQPLTVTAEIDTRLPTRVVLEDPRPAPWCRDVRWCLAGYGRGTGLSS
ncbi:hypothetical protein [Deinococcus radiophilus]|uniref:hypothetical protein n=1 Tax=Deinococcus radiophilus TaxID=32062 RepID=UPI00361FA80D